MSDSTEIVTKETDHFDDKPATVSPIHLMQANTNVQEALTSALARHAASHPE